MEDNDKKINWRRLGVMLIEIAIMILFASNVLVVYSLSQEGKDYVTLGVPGSPGTPGEKGDKGETGLQGPSGPQGPSGLAGRSGKQGEQGPQGPSGTNGLNGSNGQTGPIGPIGPKGDKGDTGNTGQTGPSGQRYMITCSEGYLYGKYENDTVWTPLARVFSCSVENAPTYYEEQI